MKKKAAFEKSSSSKGRGTKAREDRSRFPEDDQHLDFEPEDEGGDYGGGSGDDRAEDQSEREKERRKAIKERAKEFETLRAELKAKHRAAKVMTGDERAKYDAVSSCGSQEVPPYRPNAISRNFCDGQRFQPITCPDVQQAQLQNNGNIRGNMSKCISLELCLLWP